MRPKGFSVRACPGSVPEQDESRGKAKARIRFAACHRARGWLGDRGGNAPARSQGCVRLRASEGLVAGFIGFGLSLGLLQCNNRLSTFHGALGGEPVGGFLGQPVRLGPLYPDRVLAGLAYLPGNTSERAEDRQRKDRVDDQAKAALPHELSHHPSSSIAIVHAAKIASVHGERTAAESVRSSQFSARIAASRIICLVCSFISFALAQMASPRSTSLGCLSRLPRVSASFCRLRYPRHRP